MAAILSRPQCVTRSLNPEHNGHFGGHFQLHFLQKNISVFRIKKSMNLEQLSIIPSVCGNDSLPNRWQWKCTMRWKWWTFIIKWMKRWTQDLHLDMTMQNYDIGSEKKYRYFYSYARKSIYIHVYIYIYIYIVCDSYTSDILHRRMQLRQSFHSRQWWAMSR